jgi:hypothetical protein
MFTGERLNGKLVCVKGTLRYKRLGRYEMVAATGEGIHSRDSRFTVNLTTNNFYLIYPLPI